MRWTITKISIYHCIFSLSFNFQWNENTKEMQNENPFILKNNDNSVERVQVCTRDWPFLLDRDQEKSPFSVAASTCEMVWCQFITWTAKVVLISSMIFSFLSSFRTSSSLSPRHPFLLLFSCPPAFLSSCSTSSSLPHAPSPAPCLSKTAGRTLRSAKLPRLHKPGEMDDSECTAALGICQVDNPQKNGIS